MLEQLDIHTKNKLNLDTDLIHFTKIYSEWILGQNIKCKAIKLLEDSLGESLDNLRCGDDFLDMISKAWFMEEIIDKLDLIKI